MNRIWKSQRMLFAAVLVFDHLACSGGGPLLGPARMSADSTMPQINLPDSSLVGQMVTASIRRPVPGETYRWTIAHRSLLGGQMTVGGTKASFTPTRPGTATFTCIVVKDGRLRSEPISCKTHVFPDLAPGRFWEAGYLQEPRVGLAALVLGPDQILVTGGSTLAGRPGTMSTEIYTPSTGVSVRSFPMAVGRAGHAMATLDNRILVTGGIQATEAGPNSEVYDVVSGKFTPAGAMVLDRCGHTATTLPHSKGVLLAGGFVSNKGNPVPTLELFLPESDTFASCGDVELGPGHSATLLANGKVLLVSHAGPSGAWRPWAGLYDPSTGVVTPTAGQPRVAREGQAAIQLLHQAKVLVFGGRDERGPLADAEWYDPVTDTFQACPESMLIPRQEFGAILLPNGELLIAGGSTDGVTATSSAERFDPVSQCFAPTRNLVRARRNPRLVSTSPGTVIVLGGSDDADEGVGVVERYAIDPPLPWNSRPSYPDTPDCFREVPRTSEEPTPARRLGELWG